MNGLHTTTLTKPNLISRLLGRKVKENAYLEIQNLLASTPILQITAGTVADHLSKYGINLDQARPRLVAFYKEVVRHFARKMQISDEDVEQLRHLQPLFGFTATEAQEIELSVVVPLYERSLTGALSDRRLTDEEKQGLEEIAHRLRIPDNVIVPLYQKHAQAAVQEVVDAAISDRRLSLEEEAEIAETSRHLGGALVYDKETEQALDRFRLLWRLSQGDLPEVEVPIRLQRGEKCAAYVSANHYEIKTVTKAIRYSGPTVSVRIMKGVRWRAGHINVGSVTQDVTKLLDSGTLYFTNKRLLFDGGKKSTSIPLKRIIDFTFYSDGLVIEKDAGKDQMFEFFADVEILDAIMEAHITADRT